MSLVTLHLYSLKGNHSKSLSNTVCIFFSQSIFIFFIKLFNFQFLPFYRPWLIETMELIAFAPFYFFNIWQKEQKIIVSLSENFYDDVVRFRTLNYAVLKCPKCIICFELIVCSFY